MLFRSNHNLWTLAFKNIEIGIGLRGFPFEKGFYYILVDYFQKSKKIFFQNPFPEKDGFEVFSHGALPLSSCALQLSFTCKHRVAKFNFRYTFIRFHSYIYIYIYICCALKKFFPFIKNCMTYTPFLSRIWAPHYWRSHISLGISSPHL